MVKLSIYFELWFRRTFAIR